MHSQTFDAVLIYDGECPYCSLAATALQRLDDVGAISWYAEPVAPFLRAQFGDEPFAMVLVDDAEGQVYAGRTAARELATRAGLPGLVGNLVRENYDSISKLVGLASGRGRDAADLHDEYELTADGRALYDDLAAAASGSPVEAA